MRAGDLRHIITVQYPVETQDSVGQPIATWTMLFTTWAAIEPISGREFTMTPQTGTEAQIRIRIRARPPGEQRVSGKDRILFGSRIFELVAPPMEIQERHREMHLMCREVF